VNPTVFVGRPSVLSVADECAAQAWQTTIAAAGMRPMRLTRQEYKDDPWSQLHHLTRDVDGMVILGFAAPSGTTSPWLQIEASIALMVGVPVLAVPGDATRVDGIFDPTVRNPRLYRGSRGNDAEDALSRGWTTAVTERFRRRGTHSS
jgi:hypothetical protein